MVFVVKEGTVAGGTIFVTSKVLVNNVAPNIFFHKDSFKVVDKPVWVENKAINREGNFSHYCGSDDSFFPVKILLYGPDRDTNLVVVKAIKSQVIYLDASDVDSNLSGSYVVDRFSYVYDELKSLIVVDTSWRRYNN